MNKEHKNCRVCGSDKLIKYFDAGDMPLANSYEKTATKSLDLPRYPLQLMFCDDCGLSQLSIVADPVEMFSNYDYRSAVNKGYVDHCLAMAKALKNKYQLDEHSFHIDIAGNDGTLLKQFRNEIGLEVLNIDPAANLTAIAEMDGIPCITDFWGTDLVYKMSLQNDPILTVMPADLITATNVFAHVDDVNDFIKACKMSLAPKGILVMEFPYIVDFIEKFEFDTIYHEHLSYFSVLPLIKLCSLHGLKLIEVEKFDIHGGSIRVHIAHEDYDEDKTDYSVSAFVHKEINEGFNKIQKYQNWAEGVDDIVAKFVDKLMYIEGLGSKIAGFAASAKGNTLLNYCDFLYSNGRHTVQYIVDETPEKIGKYYAGTGIPIVNKSNLITDPPDYLIILSWNFAKDIMEKCRKLGYAGKFIIPIPEFKIIE